MKSINKILFSIGILLLTFTAFGQNTENKNLPKKDIKVNKEYDEDGNLIRYDSTYVNTWSSDSTHHFFNDSAFFNKMDMSRMQKRMQEQLSRFFGPDSLRQKNNKHPFFSDDFFNDDFFDSKMFRRNFHQADSSRNDFFKELEEMMKNRRQFRQEYNSKMQRELDSLRNDFLEQRREYYQKRDSIYRKHNGMHNKAIDL
ncbi:hypothetical protein [Marinifilum sp. D714]|uniref:hypothetical protein n=1 Tax=Marinifilum sp. D714 TaxID=2937523 RepID=UPI0027C7ED34|nr:hypothetical protein [Marinifilum sp. D714]MDQ2177680.1 hypothetical protein [Marinifilum sp. D714]